MENRFSISEALQVALGIPFFSALFLFAPLWGPPLLFWMPARSRTFDATIPVFTVSDAIVGIALLSVANALVSLLRYELSAGEAGFLLAAANLLVACIWILGLRRLQRHSIVMQRSRLLFQAVLHPLAIVGPPGVIVEGCLLLSSLPELAMGPGSFLARDYPPLPIVSCFAFLFWLVVCFAVRCGFQALIAKERSAAT